MPQHDTRSPNPARLLVVGTVLGVALNADDKEIYVTDMRLNGVLTFHVPEVFEPVVP